MRLKLILAVLLITVALTISALLSMQRQPHNPAISAGDIPTFTRVPIDFSHKYSAEHSLPFTGSALLDADNDRVPEIFIGGGYNQNDALLKFSEAGFKTTDAAGLSKDAGDATYGAAAIDADYDGYTDLFVARDSGIYLYNNRNGVFNRHKLNIQPAPETVPLAIAAGDIDLDGHIDLAVACFTARAFARYGAFNDPQYGARSLLLRNNGDNTFTDITQSAGVDERHDTFATLFADLDNDRLPELIFAQHAGQLRIHRNLGGGKFRAVQHALLERRGYFTSIAAADYDNDGRLDLFIGSTGSVVPEWLLRGDLPAGQSLHTDWSLLLNKGDLQFTERATESLLTDYEFGWGAAFADFNLDGLEDLAVAENYIHYPPLPLYRHPGRLLIQIAEHQFAAVEKHAGSGNRYATVAPLVADFNADGYPDLLWINLNGPARAFINNGGNRHHSKIALRNIPTAAGARITLHTARGRELVKYQAAYPELIFGLGRDDSVNRITIDYAGGSRQVLQQPAADRLLQAEPPQPGIATRLPPAAPPIKNKREEKPATAPQPTTVAAQQPVAPAAPPAEEPVAATDVEDELERLLTE
jgi:hypothetical protein